MYKIILNLESLYKGAKLFDDSEIIRCTDELMKLGVSIQLMNSCLKLAYNTNKIENLRLTVIGELKAYKFSMN